MWLGILTLYVLQKSGMGESFGFIAGGITTKEYSALMMLSLTFTGLVMLCRICQPFNLLRSILWIVCAALCVTVVCVPFLGEIVFKGWSTVQFNAQQILLLIIIVQASFPISSFLMKAFDMINPADD
jgi:hypothetical protein